MVNLYPEYNKDPNDFRPCVGAWILNEEGKLLVAQRMDNIGPYWQAPQGGVDKGEDPKMAINRELNEEIGLTLSSFEILEVTDKWLTYTLSTELKKTIWNGKYQGQQQLWFLLKPNKTIKSLNLFNHTYAEFMMWKWLSIDKAIPKIIPFKRKVYEELAIIWSKHLMVNKKY